MGLELSVESNIGLVNATITEIGNQLPYAMALAINDTLKDAQQTQRLYQRRVFTVRRPKWVDRAVKIKPFATKRTLEGRMSVDPPGGQRRADILTKFETGGRKQSRRGRHVAIPIEARRTKAGIVQRGQRPKALGLVRRGRGARGKRRTFLVPHVGIFQRVGRGRRSRVRLLYLFEHSVPIPASLRFVENAKDTVHEKFGPNFSRGMDRAMRTARRKARGSIHGRGGR